MIHRIQRNLLVLATILFIIFLCLAFSLSTHSFLYSTLITLDQNVDKLVQPLRASQGITQFMLVMTYLGNPEIIIVFELCLLAIILIVRRRRIAALFLGGIIVGEVLSVFFKTILARERPIEMLFHVSRDGYSFPSGHALLGTVFYGCLTFFIIHLLKRRSYKILVATGTALIIFLIGFSRIFLGVHWASDVIGGWLLGSAVLLCVAAGFFRLHHHYKNERITDLNRSERTKLIIVALVFGFFIVAFVVTHIAAVRSIV